MQKSKFLEKYGWLKTLLIVFLLIICIDEVLYIFFHNSATYKSPAVPTYTSQPTIDVTVSWNKYVNALAKFSIKYPKTYQLTDNSASTPASVQLLSPILPAQKTNFRLTLRYEPIVGSQSMERLISQNSLCSQIQPLKGTASILNGEQKAQIYIDTPCGQYTTTVIYTMSQSMFYTITIDTQTQFAAIKPEVDQILTTLRFN